MIAIETKYIPATNTKGSRIKASANGNTVTIGYPHELNGAAVYAEAALTLCRKMKWTGTLISGGTNHGEVFVFESSERFPI